MTLARKGTRPITVDDVPYRWKVRHKPSYGQGIGESSMIFAVERADRPGTTLVVSLPWAHPSNWLGLPSGAVRPSMVADAIRCALAQGWQPSQPGPTFVLSSPAHDNQRPVT
jgi:hypothetical protein